MTAFNRQGLAKPEGMVRVLEIALIDTLSLESSVERSSTLAFIVQTAQGIYKNDVEERLQAMESRYGVAGKGGLAIARGRWAKIPGRRPGLNRGLGDGSCGRDGLWDWPSACAPVRRRPRITPRTRCQLAPARAG